MKKVAIKLSILANAVIVSGLIAAMAAPVNSQATLIAEPLATPAAIDSSEPHLAKGSDGTIVLSWLEHSETGTALRFSELTAGGWSTAKTVTQGSDWFVNWADFPSVSPIKDELWAAHWLVKKAGGTYAYDVYMALSQDAGETWGVAFTPHLDDTATEHGFVSLFPWQNGVGALWLDGRNMATDGGVHESGSHDSGSHESGSHGAVPEAAIEESGMTLRAALVTADNVTPEGYLVDGLVCDCCQTDVAVGSQGPVAVYRNRTTDEIRDIYVSRWVDSHWSTGESVADDTWKIAGCPVNGPAIDARGDDVVVAWFTAADEKPLVRFARSNDHAETFSQAVEIANAGASGRVDVVLLDDGSAIVSWLQESNDKHGELVIRLIDKDGQAGAVQLVAPTDASRAAGFPQMISHENDLLFAWTDTSGETRQVRTSRIRMTSLEN